MPPSSLDLLDRARDSLVAALTASTAGERYVAAHLAALRAAAAVLSVRGRPHRHGRPRSVWEVLPTVAPELAEWAAFFDAGATRRAALEAGRDDVVSSREADDLVRDGETFLVLVEQVLGLPRHDVLPPGAVSLRGASPLPLVR
ncbi:SAV_6107 family HEPN domain-containing protein [Angustibacter peucedani]